MATGKVRTVKQRAKKLLKDHGFEYEELQERHPFTHNMIKVIEVFIPAKVYRAVMAKGEAHSLICRNWQDVINRVKPIIRAYELRGKARRVRHGN